MELLRKTKKTENDDNYSCTSTSDSESIQGPQIVEGYSMKREELVKPLSIKLENWHISVSGTSIFLHTDTFTDSKLKIEPIQTDKSEEVRDLSRAQAMVMLKDIGELIKGEPVILASVVEQRMVEAEQDNSGKAKSRRLTLRRSLRNIKKSMNPKDTEKGKVKLLKRKLPVKSAKSESIVWRYFNQVQANSLTGTKCGKGRFKATQFLYQCTLCSFTSNCPGRMPSEQTLFKHLQKEHNVQKSRQYMSAEDVKGIENSKDYVRRVGARKMSAVWDFFVRLDDQHGKTYTECMLCDFSCVHPFDGRTSHMLTHLHMKHNHMKLQFICAHRPACQMPS